MISQEVMIPTVRPGAPHRFAARRPAADASDRAIRSRNPIAQDAAMRRRSTGRAP
jgi:hypothetical protein